MNILIRKRRSREREYREADAAYRETGKKEHAVWRFEAMRSNDMTEGDFTRCFMEHEEREEEKRERGQKLVKKYGFDKFAVDDSLEKENG